MSMQVNDDEFSTSNSNEPPSIAHASAALRSTNTYTYLSRACIQLANQQSSRVQTRLGHVYAHVLLLTRIAQ